MTTPPPCPHDPTHRMVPNIASRNKPNAPLWGCTSPGCHGRRWSDEEERRVAMGTITNDPAYQGDENEVSVLASPMPGTQEEA